MSETISQTGACHCGAIQFNVDGRCTFNAYCHCRDCTRNRGVGPLHVLGVVPGTAVQIVRGEENLASYGEEVIRSFCTKCGCFIYSKPQDGSFVVVSPVTFQIEGPEGNNNGSCLLPIKYRAQCHINYESRTFDSVDSLPKFKGFPQGKCVLDNRGVAAGEAFVEQKAESTEDKSVNETGSCYCEAVKFSVTNGTIFFSALCHCKNCVRNRGAGPVHVLGVSPSSAFAITAGSELVSVYSQGPMEWHFCSKCGTVVSQQPKGLPGLDFVGLLPPTFHLERPEATNNGALLLPAKYLPQAHVNYESRLADYQDSLPKFKGFSHEGVLLNNDGTPLESPKRQYCDELKCLNHKPCKHHTAVHLYGFPVSQPTRACALLLTEARIPFEFHVIAPGPGLRTPEFLAINPDGAVPALVDGDLKLSEGAAILLHLAESRNITNWYPCDSKVRAKVNQWLHWSHTATRNITLKGLRPLVFQQDKAAADAWFSGDLPYILERLELQLNETPFIAGPQKTIADLMVLTEVDQLTALGLAPLALDRFPKVQAWFTRLTSELPTYPSNVHAAQEMARQIMAAMASRAEERDHGSEKSPHLVTVVMASSNTGGMCARELLAKYPDVRVRCVFRSEAKAAEFKDTKAEIVTGVDASQPESLPAAFQDAHTAVIVTTHADPARMADDAQLTMNLINAAAAAGVRHIVFLGSWTVESADAVKTIAARFVPCEALLQQLAASGGPSFTALRLGFFNQNLIDMWGARIKTQNIIPFPEVAFPPCDTDDMGRSAAAIAAVGGEGHQGKFYNISGPEVMNNEQFAAVFSRVLGREIKPNLVPLHLWEGKVPDFLFELLSHMTQKGASAMPQSNQVQILTGSHTKFEDWLERNKHHFL